MELARHLEELECYEFIFVPKKCVLAELFGDEAWIKHLTNYVIPINTSGPSKSKGCVLVSPVFDLARDLHTTANEFAAAAAKVMGGHEGHFNNIPEDDYKLKAAWPAGEAGDLFGRKSIKPLVFETRRVVGRGSSAEVVRLQEGRWTGEKVFNFSSPAEEDAVHRRAKTEHKTMKLLGRALAPEVGQLRKRKSGSYVYKCEYIPRCAQAWLPACDVNTLLDSMEELCKKLGKAVLLFDFGTDCVRRLMEGGWRYCDFGDVVFTDGTEIIRISDFFKLLEDVDESELGSEFPLRLKYEALAPSLLRLVASFVLQQDFSLASPLDVEAVNKFHCAMVALQIMCGGRTPRSKFLADRVSNESRLSGDAMQSLANQEADLQAEYFPLAEHFFVGLTADGRAAEAAFQRIRLWLDPAA